jgi:protein-L-isoaspartate(D-aspartate) O-methyltransferase
MTLGTSRVRSDHGGSGNRLFAIAWLMALLMASLVACPTRAEDWASMRERMIDEITADMRAVARYVGKAELGADVIRAMHAVPRHRFVPDNLQRQAYDNNPLPIGEGQTISQPFIVALMTELVGVNSQSKVLELGTGSGYQAAVLAEIVREVYSIEIVPALAATASSRLQELGYRNVHVREGDGTLGWPEAAPFDGIIVTAAGIEIPPALRNQLRVGARLVMPVGEANETQQLIVMTREDGGFSERRTIPVRFVPITGGGNPR